MRKFAAFAIGGALLISLSTPVNAAAPKAGASCSKVGTTSTSGGIKYTCIKSGKKFIWNKGVSVKAEAKPDINPVFKPTEPTPSPSATPSATPTPTPTPTPQVQLPAEGSICTKIGEKIPTPTGYLRCNWPGGPVSTGTWRSFTVKKLSTTASNNYKITPVAFGSCDNSGDTFDVPSGYLECRWTNGKKLQWIKINTVKQTFVNAVSPQGIDVCRLKNADAVVQTGRNSGAGKAGFPMDRTTKNGVFPKGSNEVLIVGVDFPELRGGNEIKSINNDDTSLINDWYRYFSNNQAKFNVTTIDHWINAPRSAASYVQKQADGRAASSNRFLADSSQPFVDLITKEIDLRKFSTVYMFFPRGETDFDMDLIVRNEVFNIKEGQKTLNFFGWGHDLEVGESLRWAFAIHETLHDFDIIGHAPGNGWPFGIMQNNTGVSMAMNPYEQFLLDWLPSNQIYCQDAATLTTATFSLSPVEREDNQTKMAIIKLTSTKAIVIESHGIDKWSSFSQGDRTYPPGFYSVMAYVVDLDKAVAPSVSADQRALSNQDYAWAIWARVQGGKSTDFPYFPAAFGEDIYSAVAVLGDSFLVEGIRIKFVATGDYETVEISKA